MASILDYLDWRGDITFAERPFNEVDNLLLAELSYLDFGGIVPADFAATVPLSDAVAAFTKRTPHADMGVLVPDKIPGLAQKMAASARFRDVLLSGYVCKLDEQTETQFAALCAVCGTLRTSKERISISAPSCAASFFASSSSNWGWKAVLM